MSYAVITRTAAESMPWGTRVRGDDEFCWAHEKGSRRGRVLGVLKRPIGFANECAEGEAVTIQTDGHILALVDRNPVPVVLNQGRIR